MLKLIQKRVVQLGSFFLKIKKQKKIKKIDKVTNYEKLNINSDKYFINFEKRLDRLKTKSQNELEKIKRKKKTIIGLGASHSVSTLTHHFKLNKFFDYLVDDNKKKHGLYSPGSNLIVRPVKFGKKIPQLHLCSCMATSKNNTKKISIFKKRGVKFIIPLPKFKII